MKRKIGDATTENEEYKKIRKIDRSDDFRSISLENLPIELLEAHIFNRTSPSQFFALFQVCKKFRRIATKVLCGSRSSTINLGKLRATYLENVARDRNFGLLDWAIDLGCNLTNSACAKIVSKWKFDAIPWLSKNGGKKMEGSMLGAASVRDVELMIKMCKEGFECHGTSLIDRCVVKGNVPLFEELYDKENFEEIRLSYESFAKVPKTIGDLSRAIGTKSKSEIKRESYKLWGKYSNMALKAAEFGRTELLSWMIENNKFYRFDVKENLEALVVRSIEGVFKRSVKFMKWAKRYGWKPELEQYCNTAAGKGNLEALKYLISKGCPYSKWDYECAVKEDQKHVVTWMKENLDLQSFPSETYPFI